MRSLFVVAASPLFNDDFGFRAISELFHVQAFISALAIEALICSILPWLLRLDVGCLYAVALQSLFDLMRDELRPMQVLTLQLFSP